MRLELGNNYYVEVDNLNWTLRKVNHVEEYTDKKGKVIPEHDHEVTLGYYKDFEQTVKALLKYHQNDLTEGLSLSLENYVECVASINESALKGFKNVYKGIGKEA